MRKIIAAMNMTVDGFCDHTVGVVDEELHRHYADLLANAGVILYGRKTYQLMEYWRTVVENPTGEKATDDFAAIMDKTPKVVFSRTLESVDWHSARLSDKSIEAEVADLRQQEGKDIFVGSPGLIATLTQLDLVDEYQLCIHPIIAGSGPVLFKNIAHQVVLKLQQTKTFGSGVVVLYYEVERKIKALKND